MTKHARSLVVALAGSLIGGAACGRPSEATAPAAPSGAGGHGHGASGGHAHGHGESGGHAHGHGESGGHAHAHGESGGHAFHHRFEDAAAWAKVFDSPERDAWQQPDRVLEVLALSPGMVVADVGAGTGYFTMRIARAVGPSGKVLALDVEPDMVRYLGDRAKKESLPNVDARLVEGADPKLAPASVDRVLVVDTWHHIGERPAYARALSAALKPGGKVFIVDFKMSSPHGPPKAARIEPAQAMRELGEGGLSAREVADAGLEHQWIVVGTR